MQVVTIAGIQADLKIFPERSYTLLVEYRFRDVRKSESKKEEPVPKLIREKRFFFLGGGR